jgi:tripeptidyl-peptidase-1
MILCRTAKSVHEKVRKIELKATMFLFFILILLMSNGEGSQNMRGSKDRDLFSLNDDKDTHVYKESIAGFNRKDLAKQSRISPEVNHEVIFSIKQRNIEELSRMLHDVSDPQSINYGKHKTRLEVAELTANLESRDVVVSYLTSIGATVVSETLSGEYVTANAPIRLWEEMFHTEFFTYHQTQAKGHIQKFVRAESYYLPISLDLHIESVFNTVQMPLKVFGGPMISPVIDDIDAKQRKLSEIYRANFITPDKLKVYYNQSSTTQGSSLSTQAIFATIEQFFSPADLSTFQSNFQPPTQAIFKSVGDHSSDSQCVNDANNCAEANLDVQYIMSTSEVSPTTYWYVSMYSDTSL